MARRSGWIWSLLLWIEWSVGSQAASIPDFSFIQCSDVHAPFGKDEVMVRLRTLGAVRLSPYNVTAPPPSFVLVTGDLNEFGGGNGAWETYLRYWQGFSIPIYQVPGNHDNTWDCLRPRLRALQGETYSSFDFNGCHFVGFDTATPQDPRPTIGQEGLRWLQRDLAQIPSDTPVFLFLHHPIPSKEFANDYDTDRLFDVLRPYRVVLLLVGHGHNVSRMDAEGIDAVMGGTTFGENAGCNVVSVQEGTLRVAYLKLKEADATIPLLEKPLLGRLPYPSLTIRSPAAKGLTARDSIVISATAEGLPGPGARGSYLLDGTQKGDLQAQGEVFQASLQTAGWLPGAHWLRVTFTLPDGRFYHRSTHFYLERGPVKARWRAFLDGSSRCPPTVADGTVYVGANDGTLSALDAESGKIRWTFPTGGEILTQPLVRNGKVFFGSGDGGLYAVTTQGKLLWKFEAGAAVYSAPAWANGAVVCGTNAGDLIAVEAATGRLRWRCMEPNYAIESAVHVAQGMVYAGAWDRFIYAVDAATGALRWKCLGVGSDTDKAPQYYSPADCGPVFAGGNVFVADRAYWLSVVHAPTGIRLSAAEDTENFPAFDQCGGVGLSEDGRFIYLRRTDGRLTKINPEGKVIWESEVPTGYVPTAPTERDGVVYVCSSTGRVSAVEAATGRLRWQYQATPQLYVLSRVTTAQGVVYVSGMDGSVTALTVAK